MYHFSTRLQGNIDEVEKKVTEALKEESVGVLTEIDVQATMKKKLGVDYRPYRILGACNPPLANQALQAEPEIGVLLPCNVVVREDEDGSILVTFMDPEAVLTLVEGEDVKELAKDVKGRLMRVKASLES